MNKPKVTGYGFVISGTNGTVTRMYKTQASKQNQLNHTLEDFKQLFGPFKYIHDDKGSGLHEYHFNRGMVIIQEVVQVVGLNQ